MLTGRTYDDDRARTWFGFMMHETGERLDVSIDDGVARIVLNRPTSANAIDEQFGVEFEAAAMACAEAKVRVVLISALGKQFCVGGDLKDFAGRDDIGSHLDRVTGPLHRGIATLVEADAPVIVAMRGAAAGAGLGLVCAAEIVIAGESSTFLMAYTKIGLSPDGSTSWFLARHIGLRRALDLTITNRVLSASEALAWGLVSRVVADDDLDAEAESLVDALRVGPTAAYGASARLMRSSLDRSLRDQLDAEADSIASCANGDDGREGMRAFLERRAPNFTWE
ncbi:MAG: enoyl-CoA hydratase-related protein [Acidimicrobiales bacterium]